MLRPFGETTCVRNFCSREVIIGYELPQQTDPTNTGYIHIVVSKNWIHAQQESITYKNILLNHFWLFLFSFNKSVGLKRIRGFHSGAPEKSFVSIELTEIGYNIFSTSRGDSRNLWKILSLSLYMTRHNKQSMFKGKLQYFRLYPKLKLVITYPQVPHPFDLTF